MIGKGINELYKAESGVTEKITPFRRTCMYTWHAARFPSSSLASLVKHHNANITTGKRRVSMPCFEVYDSERTVPYFPVMPTFLVRFVCDIWAPNQLMDLQSG